MKEWLIKYRIHLCALFVAGLSLYLNLAELEKARHNLTALALNIAVTFVILGILLIAIITFYSRNKKLTEKLRQRELTGPVADQLKKVGKLESLAGRADRLVDARCDRPMDRQTTLAISDSLSGLSGEHGGGRSWLRLRARKRQVSSRR